MRTIIAGSRDICIMDILLHAVHTCPFTISSIISGGARGADKLGEIYANQQNIPLIIIPAKWDIYGKSAGYRRNEEMAKQADALIALWDGHSRGTQHMINLAQKYNLSIHTCIITD